MIVRIVFLVLLAISCSSSIANDPNMPKDSFALFNGKDLTGWHGMDHTDPGVHQAMSDAAKRILLQSIQAEFKQHWRVEQGELVNDGQGVYATTNQDYGDIELWLEYKTVPLADSGVYLRGTPQIQIWDTTEAGGKWELGASKGSGGLWNNSPGTPGKEPLVHADRPFGEWNRLHVIQVGARTTVWLNDQLVVDNAIMENFWNRDLPLPRQGPIQLQTHGGEIRWRNIYVREIPAEEANKWLASKDSAGFKSIFNGKDFKGWSGAVSEYEIQDGSLFCKKGRGNGEVVFTDKSYDDFVVRLLFQLPPAGNNGLAIRYPGEGGAWNDGMCEIQVLDSEHPKYKDLDIRQYHGSAYGLVPAVRGYLRPQGEWNFQQVTIKGPTIQVELNGSIILDTDLSTVTETMDDRPHPGSSRTNGHFGFAGHDDPVKFRDISIKELN